jgi:aminocarboxymuconate-semialdehyde decarboxylase
MGLTGIELGTNVNGKSLGMPEFQEFFVEADHLGIPIFVHSLRPTMMERFTSPNQMNPVGYPTDTGLTAASLISGGTADKAPNLRIAFSHGGGTFAMILARMQHGWSGSWNGEAPVERGEGAPGRGGERSPNSPYDHGKRFFYDTLVFDKKVIAFLMDLVGHRQLLIGTDYPYVQREKPVGKSLFSMGLDPQVQEDITWNNCMRFLGLDATTSAAAASGAKELAPTRPFGEVAPH